jgi:RNA-dependent RNA polymerase
MPNEQGLTSSPGLILAEMHSRAVDFAKTGEKVGWDDLRDEPRRWPHFMAHKRVKYRSRKVLGEIYDKASGQNLEFIPDQESDFDQRILTKFHIDENTLQKAREIKVDYDKCVRRILAQHALGTEFELWTGFAMSKPPVGSDYKRQEQLGREYDSLKQRFRELCYEAAGGHEGHKIELFVAAMYKVTEEDVKAGMGYEPDIQEGEDEEAAEARIEKAIATPLISFPWVFHWVMVRIAMGENNRPTKTIVAPEMPTKKWASAEESIAPLLFTDASDKMGGSSPASEELKVGEVIGEDLTKIGEDQGVMAEDDKPVSSAMDMLADMGMD